MRPSHDLASDSARIDRTDQELLRQHAREPQGPAFGELQRRYASMIYRVCWSELKQTDLAEDAAQATLLVLHEKAPRLVHLQHLGSWLYSTARYVSANLRRKESLRVQRELDAMSQSHNADASSSDQPLAELQAALEKLSRADRDTLLDRYYVGLSVAELAAKQRISVSAAQMRLSRATTRLRSRLERMGVVVSVTALLALLDARPAHAFSPTLTARAQELAHESASSVTMPFPVGLVWKAVGSLALVGVLGVGTTALYKTHQRSLMEIHGDPQIHRDLYKALGGLYVGTVTFKEPGGKTVVSPGASIRVYMPPDASRLTFALLNMTKTQYGSMYETITIDRSRKRARTENNTFEKVDLRAEGFTVEGYLNVTMPGKSGEMQEFRFLDRISLERKNGRLVLQRTVGSLEGNGTATADMARIGDADMPPPRPNI